MHVTSHHPVHTLLIMQLNREEQLGASCLPLTDSNDAIPGRGITMGNSTMLHGFKEEGINSLMQLTVTEVSFFSYTFLSFF